MSPQGDRCLGVGGCSPWPRGEEGGSAALQVLGFCCCCFCKGEKSMKTKVKIKPSGLVVLFCLGCARAPAWVGVCNQIRPIGCGTEAAPVWASWCMGRLSRAPAWPGSGVLGCLVLLGHGTARACCAVSCRGWPAGRGVLGVWWRTGSSSECSAHALHWIKRMMCREGFAPWRGEAGAIGGSGQEVCLASGSMWKNPCLHAESRAWKTSHPGGLRAACCPHVSAAAMLEGERLHLMLLLLLLLVLVLLRRSPRRERSAVSCCERG